jgi:hypothetical protein
MMKLTYTAVVALALFSLMSCARVDNLRTRSSVDLHINRWPQASQNAATAMMDKYGLPHEVSEGTLQWNNDGPWLRTIVYRDEVRHDFPMPHTDVLEQFVAYKVPTDKFDDLAEFDGSVIAERTKGELSARCDNEAMNFLALNLAHDIVSGRLTASAARNTYAQQAMAFKAGNTAALTTGLNFSVSPSGTADPDVAVDRPER